MPRLHFSPSATLRPERAAEGRAAPPRARRARLSALLPAATVAVLLAVPAIARAQVLTSITVDGDTGDWAPVLADPWQTSYDGPGAGMADMDDPVQSTGRDLAVFAWTYDSDAFYLYTERVGSSRNRQLFWYYLDFDADGLMSTGEPVFHVSWWGRNGTTETYLYSYQAASAGGDPLGDALGRADGWTMPGTLAGGSLLESVSGGSADGLSMEARIPWSALGVSPGTGFLFHVSSSNSDNLPSQIDDNMGGPGGRVGSTFLAGLSFTPDRSTTAVPGGDAVFPHTLANTGQGADIYDLTAAPGGGFSPTGLTFYIDGNGDGLLDAGDQALVDSDASGAPDTGPVPAGTSLALLVVATLPTGLADGQSASLTVTATSAGNPAVSAQVLDTVTVATPSVTLVKAVSAATAAPGDVLTYSVAYSSGGAIDAFNVVIVDPVPPDTAYVAGSAAGPGAGIEFSHDGGATYDASDAAPVTHIRWTIAAPLAPGDGGTVSFQARVN